MFPEQDPLGVSFDRKSKMWKKAEAAICIIPPDAFHVHHFQHAIQYIYKCWSWWQLHPEVPPILVDRYPAFRGSPKHAFSGGSDRWLSGMLSVFRNVGVKILGEKEWTALTNIEKSWAMVPKVCGGWKLD